MVEVVDLPQPDSADQTDAFAAMDREADAVYRAENLRLGRGATVQQLGHHAANAFDTLAQGYSFDSFSTTRSGFRSATRSLVIVATGADEFPPREADRGA